MLIGWLDRTGERVHDAWSLLLWMAAGWLTGGVGWLVYALGGRILLVIVAFTFVVEELFMLVRVALRNKSAGGN